MNQHRAATATLISAGRMERGLISYAASYLAIMPSDEFTILRLSFEGIVLIPWHLYANGERLRSVSRPLIVLTICSCSSPDCSSISTRMSVVKLQHFALHISGITSNAFNVCSSASFASSFFFLKKFIIIFLPFLSCCKTTNKIINSHEKI